MIQFPLLTAFKWTLGHYSIFTVPHNKPCETFSLVYIVYVTVTKHGMCRTEAFMALNGMCRIAC